MNHKICTIFQRIFLVYFLLLNLILNSVNALTVDNQLVSARNDCFERIALEAMLQFESTFRTEDTNSLKLCQEKCLQTGDRCQSISFGVHRRGNGTCQLSEEKYGTNGGRPAGVIFDPDFDLYTRKTNCFDLSDNTITAPEIRPIGVVSGSSSSSSSSIEPPTPTIHLPNRPIEALGGAPLLVVNPSPPTTGATTYDAPLPPPTTNDRLYFTHEIYPLYKYPMLYEHNYPAPNDEVYIPGGYAANIPPVEDRYRPPPTYAVEEDPLRPIHSTPHGPPRPIFGLGYGNGYSYGAPERFHPTTMRPNDLQPNYTPSNDMRPNYEESQPDPLRPDYTNRPDPPQDHPSDGYGMGSSMRPPPNYVRRNSTESSQHGNRYVNDKTISTYFNPDDYLPQDQKKPTSMDFGHNRYGQPLGNLEACFRRVLAGKRISPHWIQRTISCERIEECMRECGQERRFMCEGFNYRLDPSGNGQGECELIQIPLSQMDLYSSSNKRDTNLLRHPDYDYYERDRNAPSSCRRNICQDCSKDHFSSNPIYFKPSSSSSGWSFANSGAGGSSFGSSGYGDVSHYRPQSSNERGPPLPPPPPSSSHLSSGSGSYESSHASSHASDYHSSSSASGSYEFSSYGSNYFDRGPSSVSADHSTYIDRHDLVRPETSRYPSRPDRWESISSSGYDSSVGYRPRPTEFPRGDKYRPPFHGVSEYSPSYNSGPGYNYLDRGYSSPPRKPSKFVPYLIGGDKNWGNYGGSYGGSYSKHNSYWGLSDSQRRKDQHDFNYFELGSNSHKERPPHDRNSVISYASSSYGHGADNYINRNHFRQQWTRRPGMDECSAKSGEGFRLNKAAVRHSFTVPTLNECERLCSDQNGFSCQTFSYRYNPSSRDNCMLCDRPINRLDYYADIEPDRDYDIYSMSDDMNICRQPPPPPRRDEPGTALLDPTKAQCFFRAIDATRFFKSIVRDSLTVRSIGECELECIRSKKFTCRAFAYRFGQQRHAGVIDNCQLSDWPVRDMDKERHLILDATFDIFERASYGHGCEIQPLMDEKHKKLCYLGYGSAAKLLPPAIKKVITVPSEVECKKECVRFRETSPFKCFSFSYGSRASSYNCELSDLDQSELKIDVHYTHTKDQDYWLFAWNPFDWTCRDKVTTIGGSRVNNDRRMDIFREPGEISSRHYTVTGKPCRRNSPCAKNLITGFYSCEMDGSEVGSWDYCCKADHPCGYSRGFDYPWCFVGDEPEMWRKCSESYYPKNHTRTHAGITLSASKDTKKHTDYQPSQHPPRPGGLQSLSDFAAARLWPVTYLYSEGPPNATEFSNFVDCNRETC